MRRGDGCTEAGRSEDRRHRSDVCGHAGVGIESGELEAHRLDDLPPAPERAERDRAVCGQRHPLGNDDVLARLVHRRIARAQHEGGDHAHRLLGVIRPVAKGQSSRRDHLGSLENRVVVVPLRHLLHQVDEIHRQEGDGQGDSRRRDDADGRLAHAAPVDGSDSTCRDTRSHETADDRVTRGRGHADVPRDVVPCDRREERGEDDSETDVVRLHGLGHRVRHGRAHDEVRDEVEERREGGRPLGGQGTGGHHGGHRVGRVMEAVGEVEDERQGDDQDDREEHEVHAGSRRRQPHHRPMLDPAPEAFRACLPADCDPFARSGAIRAGVFMLRSPGGRRVLT